MSRSNTVEFSSYLNSLISNEPVIKPARPARIGSIVGAASRRSTSAAAPMPRRRSDNASRAASRAKAVSLGAGGSDKVVCAISEGRGSPTVVGLCFLVVGTSECIICNIVDSQTYIRTLQKLDVFDPTEILMPIASCGTTQPSGSSTGKSKLCILVERYFPGAKLVPTNRKEYNASLGIECLTKWAAPEETEGLSFELSSKYYTACAAAAAIQYTQSKYHINYTTNSVRIKFQASEDSMALNSTTIKSLELVHNSLEATRGMSLYKLMNKTHTAMGARMLRSCILQPLTNVETLTGRQDAIKELYEEALIFSQITKKLKSFEDLDRLFTTLSTVWKTKKKHISDQRVNQLLILKEAIDHSLELYHLLAPLKSALLVELRSVFGSDIVKSVKDLLATVLAEDCRWAQGALELRKQKCYAVLSGANGFLDVTRQIYEEYNMDIGEMVKAYTKKYHVNFETRYDVKRGYILRIRNPDQDEGAGQLPDDVFLNKHKANRFLECTTLEMIKCNMRINNVLSEIILVSDQIVEELFENKLTQPHLSLELFKVSEAVAVLDLVCAFTELVTSSFSGYVRPEFSTSQRHSNKMAVKLARHPILERTMGYKPYVPNDYYGSLDTARMNIVQGVNMSGKSIYLRTIALIAVMAQTGSFVPAEYAVLPVYRALYTRITPDASDLLSSTFSAEMTEMAYILRNLSVSGNRSNSMPAAAGSNGAVATTANDDGLSLVIVDELGRGSSVVDGFAITLAITDKLAQMPGVVTFMCTHFQDLVRLMGQRPGVATLEMQVNLLDAAGPNLSRSNEQEVVNGSTIVMHYKAQKTNHSSSAGRGEGSLDTTTTRGLMPGYGLKIASTMVFPAQFLAEAVEVKRRLAVAQAARSQNAATQGDTALARKKLVLELYETLVHISKLDATQLDPTSLRRWLVALQNKFIESCTE